ncbi:MAG: hypothetical protein IPQ07_41850 [Myxococcales bacterium]|nr:hypothetical protein [Myxococcales bacterium]
MRLAAFLVVLSACTAEPSEPDLGLDSSDLFRPLSLHIVSSRLYVQVDARDASLGDRCRFGAFPELGKCTESTDTNYCEDGAPSPDTCLHELVLEQDGRVVARQKIEAHSAIVFGLGIQTPEGTEPTDIVLRGCGAEARIPIRLHGPRPLLVASRLPDGSIETSWTTDRPAASALVGAGFGTCHTVATSYTFPAVDPFFTTAWVRALDPPLIVSTPWGDALSYASDTGEVELPPASSPP